MILLWTFRATGLFELNTIACIYIALFFVISNILNLISCKRLDPHFSLMFDGYSELVYPTCFEAMDRSWDVTSLVFYSS